MYLSAFQAIELFCKVLVVFSLGMLLKWGVRSFELACHTLAGFFTQRSEQPFSV